MPNMIELVNKYLPILDAQYRLESRSAILDVAPEFIQMTRDAKKVKIAKMRVDGLADYSRNSGFTVGSADLTWEEHEFTQDRGRAIQIDAMDNLETFGMAFGRLSGEFQRQHVIPEIDAYRFAKYYQNAGAQLEVTVTAGDILSKIDDMDATMDDNEVPEEGRILFVAPTVYKLIINDPQLSKKITVDGVEDKTVNKKFYYYDGHLLIKVPSTRFYTDITLLSGGQGQTGGGYKASTDAKAIGMLMVQRDAVIQLVKRRIARIWAPTREEMAANGADGVNPSADAWKFDFRVYHDAWTLDERLNGIVGAVIVNATVESVEIYSEDENVEIADNAATIKFADVRSARLLTNVEVTNGATKAVTWKSSDPSIVAVDNVGTITVLATGTATITATSVWDTTKADSVAITVEE